MNLKKASTDELRRELSERDERERQRNEAEWRAKIKAEFGVCKAEFGVTGHSFVLRSDEPIPVGPCGEEFCSYEWNVVREILQNPPGWPPLLPVPRERAWVVGQEIEITLTCPRGHAEVHQQMKILDEPIKPMF